MRFACPAFLFLAAFVLGAEDGDMHIGLKPGGSNPREISTEDFKAVVKRILAAPAEQAEPLAPLVSEFRENPELFTRLLIPPGYPRSYSRSEKGVRARVAAILGQSRDLRALQPLVDSAVYDPEDSVRAVCVKALKLLEEPVALRKLVDLAIARDYRKYPWAARKSACTALRRYGDVGAVARILRELSYELAGGSPIDPKNPLRGVASGLGSENGMGLPSAPPDLQLGEHDLYPVLSAMKEVTGMSFNKNEKDFKTWQLWWSKESAKFKFQE